MDTQDLFPFDRETGGAGAPKTGSLRERIAALSAPRPAAQPVAVEPEAEEVWDDGEDETSTTSAFPWADRSEEEAAEDEADSLAFIRAQAGGALASDGDDPLGLGGGGGAGFAVPGRAAPLVFEDARAQEEVPPVSFAKARQEGPDTWTVQKPVEMKLKREPPAPPVYSEKPVRTGPNAPACRVLRTDDPSRFPVPRGGRDGRYIAWDLEDERVKVAVAWLAWPDGNDYTNRQRYLSADLLIEEWERTWGENPSVADIVHAWWRATHTIVDVAAAAGMPGAPRNAAFGRLMALNAMEFADRLEVDYLVFEKEMKAIGIPTPPLAEPPATNNGEQ